jgi:hypothetical protein
MKTWRAVGYLCSAVGYLFLGFGAIFLVLAAIAGYLAANVTSLAAISPQFDSVLFLTAFMPGATTAAFMFVIAAVGLYFGNKFQKESDL